MKNQLAAEHHKADHGAYRHAVCDAVFDSVILLVEKMSP